MNIELTEISEPDYRNLDRPILFEDPSLDRVFAVISNGKSQYKFGWQSTLVKPEVTSIDNALCSIGIDQVFVVFDFDNGTILLKLSLDCYFMDSIIHEGFLYAATQMSVKKIDITNAIAVVETYDLPELFDSFDIQDGVVVVKCMDEEVINLG